MVTSEPGASQKADHINQGRLTVVNSVTMCDCAKQSASARTTPRYAVTSAANRLIGEVVQSYFTLSTRRRP